MIAKESFFPLFFQALRGYPWWQVAIEWLLIGLGVYFVVRFLRGTRGARLLKGSVVVLIGVYIVVRFVGERFGLERIDFLYSEFLKIASLAVIVVFQPELRRALMRLGETSLFRGFSPQVTDEIDALVEAATFLSRRKIGALIALEREIRLGGSAENGTRLNAELSAALLNTIFWPNSPLHDLGVIISNGRITYAGVQFPLAETGEVPAELGSRHRAAVGMSQDSDAVVLVVSEETGDISVAERGQLIRKLTPDRLRAMLREMLGRGEDRREERLEVERRAESSPGAGSSASGSTTTAPLPGSAGSATAPPPPASTAAKRAAERMLSQSASSQPTSSQAAPSQPASAVLNADDGEKPLSISADRSAERANERVSERSSNARNTLTKAS